MASQNGHTDQRPSSNAPASRIGACRKKNFGSGSFVSNLKDHIHEFLHASVSEHRMCLKDTIQKMFEMSKAFIEKSTGPTRESSPPLQTTTKD
ncbi:hypothetical protein FNV43_RR17621 [Rhamnella rubrinervis]|uniref:Uncharacterized protein n=1 Tax=Rhamnella rubrinervis TaxID=2594499 RepID=A0A8K0GV10_9ROSA|nr:hypothetical protein FNV43_RR17621 [Rhamnella rubrinervis]